MTAPATGPSTPPWSSAVNGTRETAITTSVSFRTAWSFTGTGHTSAVRPSTTATLKTLDPTTFPTAMSPRPPSAAITDVASSGVDVPNPTMVSPTTIRYQFTVEDPSTWTSPWSGEYEMTRIDGPLFEYACHEGNYGIVNILRGARLAESGSR